MLFKEAIVMLHVNFLKHYFHIYYQNFKMIKLKSKYIQKCIKLVLMINLISFILIANMNKGIRIIAY